MLSGHFFDRWLYARSIPVVSKSFQWSPCGGHESRQCDWKLGLDGCMLRFSTRGCFNVKVAAISRWESRKLATYWQVCLSQIMSNGYSLLVLVHIYVEAFDHSFSTYQTGLQPHAAFSAISPKNSPSVRAYTASFRACKIEFALSS